MRDRSPTADRLLRVSLRPRRRSSEAPVGAPAPEPPASRPAAAADAVPPAPPAGHQDAFGETTYNCGCGLIFSGPVVTSVACPRCGDAQAW